jgi:hypothetical protein
LSILPDGLDAVLEACCSKWCALYISASALGPRTWRSILAVQPSCTPERSSHCHIVQPREIVAAQARFDLILCHESTFAEYWQFPYGVIASFEHVTNNRSFSLNLGKEKARR